jgi:hypothetical protein
MINHSKIFETRLRPLDGSVSKTVQRRRFDRKAGLGRSDRGQLSGCAGESGFGFIGALSGALSFVMTSGDTEVARQVWQGTTEGPYYITPDLAKKSIGERPLLAEKQ